MRTVISAAYRFGASAGTANALVEGWSTPEDGFVWSIGERSTIRFTGVEAPHGFFLEITCGAVDFKPQRIKGTINGRGGAWTTIADRAVIAWYGAPVFGDVVAALDHPDAVRPVDFGHPNDDRPIAIRLEKARILPLTEPIAPPSGARAAGVPVPDDRRHLTLGFESLGQNCELGFVQRHCKAEPLGLCRFAGVTLDAITDAIDEGFAGIGTPETIRPEFDQTGTDEWLVTELRYRIQYHTFRNRSDIRADALIKQEQPRLGFLARRLLSDIQGAEKVFVHQRKRALPICEALPLFLALRRRGDGNLLIVEEDPCLAGSVEEILPGLYRGHINRFAPYARNAEVSLDSWLAVLTCAREIVGPY